MRSKIILVFLIGLFCLGFGDEEGEQRGRARVQFKCGQKHSTAGFIFGGIPAKPHDWPWLVAMIYTPYDQYFCSGSLVSRKHVVSGENETLNLIRCMTKVL
jgi:hypothetical protein